MGCLADYPIRPCPFGFTGICTREACGGCKNFVPPKHILAWCKLWDRDGVLCMRPKSDCATCPEKNDRGPGRPAGESPIDWNNPTDVNKYQARLMKKRRREGKVKEAARTVIDGKKPAEYHKAYYAKNKLKILARRHARRQGQGEPGSGQV